MTTLVALRVVPDAIEPETVNELAPQDYETQTQESDDEQLLTEKAVQTDSLPSEFTYTDVVRVGINKSELGAALYERFKNGEYITKPLADEVKSHTQKFEEPFLCDGIEDLNTFIDNAQGKRVMAFQH